MASKQHGERIEELRKDIETGVKELRNSGTWQRYLDYMGRFHQYSWNNILLMLMQSNGNSSLVAGFRQWQTRGRVVRKDEHGMKIFGFSTRTVKDEDGNPQLDENGDPIQKSLVSHLDGVRRIPDRPHRQGDRPHRTDEAVRA